MDERQRIKGHTYITVDRNPVDHVLSMLKPYNLEQILQPRVYIHVTFKMPMVIERKIDWVKLVIPECPKIVKKPMDLSAMRRRLDSGAYPTAEKFRGDFKLIISNCNLSYNPLGTPIYQTRC